MREKDLSDVVRRVGQAQGWGMDQDGTCNVTVNGGTTRSVKGLGIGKNRGNHSSRSTIDIYVDPADDPDIGEIVVVKKKKSRAALEGIRWALGEVTNASGVEGEVKEETDKVKIKTEEKEKWWSIGRGKRDSKEKEKDIGKVKLRQKGMSWPLSIHALFKGNSSTFCQCRPHPNKPCSIHRCPSPTKPFSRLGSRALRVRQCTLSSTGTNPTSCSHSLTPRTRRLLLRTSADTIALRPTTIPRPNPIPAPFRLHARSPAASRLSARVHATFRRIRRLAGTDSLFYEHKCKCKFRNGSGVSCGSRHAEREESGSDW